MEAVIMFSMRPYAKMFFCLSLSKSLIDMMIYEKEVNYPMMLSYLNEKEFDQLVAMIHTFGRMKYGVQDPSINILSAFRIILWECILASNTSVTLTATWS